MHCRVHRWKKKIDRKKYARRQNFEQSLRVSHGLMAVKMKLLARSYVWWPTIQSDIKKHVTDCEICQATRSVPKEIASTKWPNVSYPFELIHLDFFYMNGKTFLILVDAYNKFVEINMFENNSHTRIG